MARTKNYFLISISLFLVIVMVSSVYNIKLVYSTTSFASDFETGDLSQWTGTLYGGGTDAPIVQQNVVNHGNYALMTTANGEFGWSVVTYDLPSYENILYFRSYVLFTATPSVGEFVNIYPMIAASSSIPLAYMHLFNDAGVLKWRLAYKTDSVAENFAYSNTPTIQINQWYYIEIMYKLGNGDGEAKAWIAPSGSAMFEASPTIVVSNLVNDDYSIGHLQLGVYRPSSLALSVYHDYSIATNQYIGIESSFISPPPPISPQPPSSSHGIISLTFDDGASNQYTTAFPLMRTRGISATFYIPTQVNNQLSIAQLLEMQAAGNEIGSHSVTHPDFTKLTEQQIRYECQASKAYLQSYGLIVNNFAYPFGTGDYSYTNTIVSQYYRSAREGYYHPMKIGQPIPFQISTYYGESIGTEYSTLLTRLKNIVDRTVTYNEWTLVSFHNVVPTSIAIQYGGIGQTEFAAFLDYAKASGVQILTVNQALNQLT